MDTFGPAENAPISSNPARPGLRWTRSSWVLISSFLFVIGLILIVWWPLVEEYAAYFQPQVPWWQQTDWLLILIFLFMSAAVTINADLRKDWLLVCVGFVGGFVIEFWGTNTELWAYYTGERPPLWIIPAWPIAAITIKRMARLTSPILKHISLNLQKRLFYACLIIFIGLFLLFVGQHTFHPANFAVLAVAIGIILIPQDRGNSWLTFVMGSLLGLFLEYWGTSRECWQYYNHAVPPLFSVLAHGFASVVFWQGRRLVLFILEELKNRLRQPVLP
jgi:hypothetical protein